MSRPTYEECRKVAEKLRYDANNIEFVCGDKLKALAFDLFGFGSHSESEIFARLADLIEPMYEPCPVWIAWVESLKNGDVVDRFAYDLIKHGGDMGPNGNTWNGIDEGVVLTNQLFDKFKADFKKEIEADGKERK